MTAAHSPPPIKHAPSAMLQPVTRERPSAAFPVLFSRLSLVALQAPPKGAELTALLSEVGRRRGVPLRSSAGTNAEVDAGRTAGEVGPSLRDHRKPREGNTDLLEPGGFRPNRTGTTTPKMLRRFWRSSREPPHPWDLMSFVLSGWL